jgi:ammonia channel protein AmtB
MKTVLPCLSSTLHATVVSSCISLLLVHPTYCLNLLWYYGYKFYLCHHLSSTLLPTGLQASEFGVGLGDSDSSSVAPGDGSYTQWLFGWAVASVSVTIVSGAVAER